MGLFRIVLIVAAGIAVYMLLKRRDQKRREPAIDLEWQVVFKNELSSIKGAVPAGYYVNLLALSRSRITREDCVARLDDLVGKMKNEDLETQVVETLILKLEQDYEVH